VGLVPGYNRGYLFASPERLPVLPEINRSRQLKVTKVGDLSCNNRGIVVEESSEV